jgi:cytochrome c biogenesis protein
VTATEPVTRPAEETPDVATLSTQPKPVERDRRGGGPPAALRRGWRRLTSMRTALVLLFLLAVAAVPGSLLPQRPLNPLKVDRYLTEHRALGPLLDRIGLFDVFGSPWFAAIYLLLFVSLVGCLVPRIRLHLRALRSPPPAAPRHLDRLPESASYQVDAEPGEVAERARRALRGWRVVNRDEPGAVLTLAAEKGYLRETGNLIFHVALTVLLAGIAAGRLFGYQGTVLVEEGKGFCNSVALYDAFRPGRMVRGGALAPFCVDRLESFTATYDPDGTPALFRADISYSEGLDGPQRRYSLEVNRPLRIEGVRVYLLSHGFSPRFTVRTTSGQVFADYSAPFLPQNSQLLSEGVLKLPEARPQQLALFGLFAPAAVDLGGGVLASASPRPELPAAAIVVFRGDLGLDSGRPQSVYTVDQTQIDRGALVPAARATMAPGDSLRLRDGTRVTFDGYRQWATIQVSHDPGQPVVLGAAAFIVLGLLLSLSVRRRRVWLRLRPSDGATDARRTVVAVGGLARTDAGSFTAEFARLVDGLRRIGPACRED